MAEGAPRRDPWEWEWGTGWEGPHLPFCSCSTLSLRDSSSCSRNGVMSTGSSTMDSLIGWNLNSLFFPGNPGIPRGMRAFPPPQQPLSWILLPLGAVSG